MLDEIRGILAHDLDPEFLRAVGIDLGWRYADSFDRLAVNARLPDSLQIAEFGRQRGLMAVNALVTAADRFGIPYNFRRLEANGQDKLLVKMGRLVLIQESILTIRERPHVSDYKAGLADAYGIIQQLELDLGDQPLRIRDWSNGILAVLLHAPAGPKFTARDRELGALMLGFPDSEYRNWLIRLDLLRVAKFGFSQTILEDFDEDIQPIQEDRVFVTRKKWNREAGNL